MVPQLSYEQCIEQTLQFGGDTDTNAAIVGGMIGAYYGRSGLPKNMVDTLLNCDLTKGTKPNRPELVQPAKSY